MGVKVVVMLTSGGCSSDVIPHVWYSSPNTDGTRPTGATVAGVEWRAMVAKGLKRLCKQAGVDYHSLHKLSHGHTVYALKKARDIADLKAVSQNLMHASLTITDRAYGMRSGQDMAKAIVGLGKTVETAG